MFKRIATIIIILIPLGKTIAQDIEVKVEAPAVVEAGEQFRITWVVNSRGGDFEAPSLSDFYRLMGPQTSFSQSTQIINGKVATSIQNSFSYYLQATSTGKYTIAAGKYTEKKTEYFSDPVDIEVIDRGTASTRQGDQQESSQQENNTSNNDD